MAQQFWLDANSLIEPAKGPYAFSRVPQYWDFVKAKSEEGVLGSPELVLDLELTGTDPKKADDLEFWAKPLRGTLFLPADEATQRSYAEIADWVENNERFKEKPQHVAPFLAKADCWLIAYAKAHGGRVVTFEKPEPKAKKPKIPDVAAPFGVVCINLWLMLEELGFRA